MTGALHGALHGRGAEAAVLREALANARAGRGAVVVIEGEAGIGKTRLLAAATEWALQAGLVVRGAAVEPLERGRPFGAFIDALGTPVDENALGAGAVVGGLTPWRDGLSLTAEARFAWQDTVCDQIDRLASRAPLLLTLDDLQWADAGTIATAAALCRRSRRLALALVLAWRSAPPVPELTRLTEIVCGLDVPVLHLGPLDDDAVAALVADCAGAPAGPGLLGQAAGAAGNPFYITTLIRALVDDGAVNIAAGRAEATERRLPTPAREAVLRRFVELDADTLALLRAGAVLAAPFTLDHAAGLVDRSAVTLGDAVAGALRSGLLIEQGDRLRFAHDLVREAVYDDLPAAVRAALHRRAARLLSSDSSARLADAARHYSAAGVADDPDAIASLRAAAREIADQDPASAAELLAHGMALACHDRATRAELAAERVEALVGCGRPHEAAALARQTLTMHPSPLVAARVRIGLAGALMHQGDAAGAARELDHARATSGLSNYQCSVLTAELAQARLYCYDLDAADAEATAAIEAGTRYESVATTTLGWCVRSRVAALRGDVTFAVDAGEHAVGVAGADPDAARRLPDVYLALALMSADRFAEARDVLATGLRGTDDAGLIWLRPRYLRALAGCAFCAGDWDDAIAAIDTALDIATDHGSRTAYVQNQALRGLIDLHRGNLTAARAAAAAGYADLAIPGADGAGIHLLLWLDALLHEHDGDIANAARLLTAAGDLAAALAPAQQLWFTIDLVRLLIANGDRASARAVARRLAPICQRAGTPTATAAATFAAALADGTPADVARAADAYARSPRPLDRAQAAEMAARRLADDGEPQAAIARLRDALDEYERLGARLAIHRVRAALRQLGEHPPSHASRTRRSTGVAALTPTEQTIVACVIEGLTNPQIAHRLFIARRTVATHLEHIYLKTGLPNRTALAAALATTTETTSTAT